METFRSELSTTQTKFLKNSQIKLVPFLNKVEADPTLQGLQGNFKTTANFKILVNFFPIKLDSFFSNQHLQHKNERFPN